MKDEKKKISNAERARALGISARTLYRQQADSKLTAGMQLGMTGAPETLAGLKIEKLKKEIAILDSRRERENYKRLEQIFMAGMSCATSLHSPLPSRWADIYRTIADADLVETTTIMEVFKNLEADELRECPAQLPDEE